MTLFLHWVAMHGYACYVWSAYGMVFGVLIFNGLSIMYLNHRTRKRLQQWFKRSGR